jgi:hypothetical protein
MDKRRILWSAATGAWLSNLPSLLNGSDLSAEEFRDGLRLRFGLPPISLPPQCNGCSKRFTTEHGMSCCKGGMILQYHNNLVATWGQLCGQAHTPSTVFEEPLIQISQDVQVAGSTHTVIYRRKKKSFYFGSNPMTSTNTGEQKEKKE